MHSIKQKTNPLAGAGYTINDTKCFAANFFFLSSTPVHNILGEVDERGISITFFIYSSLAGTLSGALCVGGRV